MTGSKPGTVHHCLAANAGSHSFQFSRQKKNECVGLQLKYSAQRMMLHAQV